MIYESHILEKIEEITEKLESDIQGITPDPKDKYSCELPWNELVEELKELGIKHKRSLVEHDYYMCVDNVETYSVEEHQKNFYPDWNGIFDETPRERYRRLRTR